MSGLEDEVRGITDGFYQKSREKERKRRAAQCSAQRCGINYIQKQIAARDYKTCIGISSQGALKEMRVPCIFCILFPLVTGFIFGPYFVGGVSLLKYQAKVLRYL